MTPEGTSLELRHLESFREVVRTGSFTAAARKLHMTQPAVSLHIKALERALGSHLMDRDGRGVRLTESGKALLEAVDVAFAALEDGARRVREIEAPEQGTVVLACGDTVALNLLPPILKVFRKRFPQAEVAIRNHGSQEIVEMVLRREADLGLITRPPHLDGALWARTVLEDRLRLVLPKGHALADAKTIRLGDLRDEPAVLLAKPAETRSLMDRGLRAVGVELRPVMESGNLEVVKTYVREGLGLSIVPDLALTAQDARRFVVRDLPSSFPARKLAVIRRKDRPIGLLAGTLLEQLADHLRAG